MLVTRKRFLCAGLVTVLLSGALLAGCGSKPAPSAPPGPSTPAPTPGQTQEIVIAQGTDAVTMDPANTTQITAMQPFNFIFNKLINRDQNMKLVPELADSWKSLDATTWEIKLHQGVTFQNGEKFDAESVTFTLDRLKTPGGTQASSGFTTIKEVKAVDPLTVHIITNGPDPLLPARLASWGSYMLPAAYARQAGTEGLAKSAVGTGPFKLSEWKKDDKLVLEAYPNYWGEKPKYNKVTFRSIPDNFARISALLAGQVDIAVNVPPDGIDQITKSKQAKVVDTPANAIDVFIYGSDEPLKNKLVRQALNYAIDREKIIKELYKGYGIPVAQGAAPTDFGYNPNIKPFPYDPAKAKELLAQAGYPNGFDLDVQSAQGYILNDKQVVEAVVQMLKAVGIRANPKVLEMARRTEMLGSHTIKGMLLINPGSTLFDADGIVWRLLQPSAIGGSYWARSAKDTDFYKLMEGARYSIDTKARQDAYYQAAEIMRDDPPWLYLWQEYFLYGIGSKIDYTPRMDTQILPNAIKIK